MFAVRRVPAWRSATGGVAGDARYTAFGFANPTRHVLGNLLLTRAGHVELEKETRAEEDEGSSFTGPDMPPGEQQQRPTGQAPPGDVGGGAPGTGSPADAPDRSRHRTYSTDVVELVEIFLYRPAIRPLRRLVAAAKGLQSGRLDAYISYLLITLVALIAVVVALS